MGERRRRRDNMKWKGLKRGTTFFLKKASQLVLLGLLCLGCGCGGNDFTVDLQNGYRLWKMNANEVCIAQPDNSLIIGPKIVLMNTDKEYIFGLVEHPQRYSGLLDITSGYFLVDTKNNTWEKGLSKDAWSIRLKACGISYEPELKRPTRRFRGIKETDHIRE